MEGEGLESYSDISKPLGAPLSNGIYTKRPLWDNMSIDALFDALEIERRLRELNPKRPPLYRWNTLHSEWLKTYIKDWHARNPEKYAKYKAKYESSERARELRSIRTARRRTLEHHCRGDHTLKEWQAIKVLYKNRCAYCGRKTRLTKDHIIPLTLDGTNDISNIVPSCRACNASKHNIPLLDWVGLTKLQLHLIDAG